MKMEELLSAERVVPRLRARDKRDVLRELAAHASRDADIPADTIARAVLEAAEMPAFGPRAGVALPHAVLPGLHKPILTFAKLEAPVDFGVADGSKTDLVAMLLSSCESPREHLQALACIARTLRDRNVRDLLRAADSRDAIYVILCGSEERLRPEPTAAQHATSLRQHADG